MTSSGRRIIAVLTALAAMAVTGAPSLSASSVELDAALTASEPLAGEDRVDPREAQAVADMQGVTPAIARRLVVHEREVNELYARLLEHPPAGFAGVWMDPTSVGSVVMGLADDVGNRTEALRAARRLLSVPGALRAVVVPRSRAELSEVRRRLEQDAALGRLPVEVLGTYVDEPANRVVVNVPASTEPDAIARLQTEFPSTAVEAIGTMTDDAIPTVKADLTCVTVPTACNPLRGGASVGACTIGFVAKNSAGTRRVITAGHCSNTNSNHNGTAIGTLVLEKYGGSVDAQTFSINAGWESRNWVINGAASQKYAITSVSTVTNLATGTALCRYGVTSGLSCGKVKNGNWSGTFAGVSGWTNMLLTDNCAQPGDSGGPYYADNRAYSVHKGTSTNIFGGCSWAISSYVANVQSALAVTILTAP